MSEIMSILDSNKNTQLYEYTLSVKPLLLLITTLIKLKILKMNNIKEYFLVISLI